MRILIIILVLASATSAQDLSQHPTIQKMLKESNRLRAEKGLVPNIISLKLTRAAQDQARYMARTHDFEHKTQKNGTPGVRAARYGYSGTVKENIGRGLPSIAKVFVWWKNSPSHWQAIIGGFDDVGFGYAVATDGTQYWVSLYGSPRKFGLQMSPKEFIFPASNNFLLIGM
jgi:uncharacterized protein YkwD